MGDEITGELFPLAFCLMEKKTEESYILAESELKKMWRTTKN
jgi:hypothetical protein